MGCFHSDAIGWIGDDTVMIKRFNRSEVLCLKVDVFSVGQHGEMGGSGLDGCCINIASAYLVFG